MKPIVDGATAPSMSRRELGATLRAWRDRVTPEDIGLIDAGPRRTPGLRRQEVARIAGVSPDYLSQLEQGRALAPSAQILGALARALRATPAEQAELFCLAGLTEPAQAQVSRHLPDEVGRMVGDLQHAPAAVYDARWDPIAWNPLWTAVMGDPAERPLAERNLARRQFLGLPTRVIRDRVATLSFETALIADLRGTTARYPGDQQLAALVGRLSSDSEDFRSRWAERPAGEYSSELKTIDHPEVGGLSVACTVLTPRRHDLRVVIYTPHGPAASRSIGLLDDRGQEVVLA